MKKILFLQLFMLSLSLAKAQDEYLKLTVAPQMEEETYLYTECGETHLAGVKIQSDFPFKLSLNDDRSCRIIKANSLEATIKTSLSCELEIRFPQFKNKVKYLYFLSC